MMTGLIQRTALVTGATGCLGTHLTRRLAASGFLVTALVRDRRRAAHLAAMPGVELREGDINDPHLVDEAISGTDQVYHAAACVHAPPGTAESDFFRVNVEGTRCLVEAAIRHRVSSFVFYSSVAVYPPGDDVADEESPVDPPTHYGQSKLAAEKIVLEGGARSTVRMTVLRLPVVYGEGDRGNVAALIDAIRCRRYLIIGDGNNEKSMVAVGNVVDASLTVAEDVRSAGRIYIVADDRPYSQREIAQTIAELLGDSRKIHRLPLLPALALGMTADIAAGLLGRALPISLDRVRKLAQNTRFNSSRIVRELGIRPRIGLRHGLREEVAERCERVVPSLSRE